MITLKFKNEFNLEEKIKEYTNKIQKSKNKAEIISLMKDSGHIHTVIKTEKIECDIIGRDFIAKIRDVDDNKTFKFLLDQGFWSFNESQSPYNILAEGLGEENSDNYNIQKMKLDLFEEGILIIEKKGDTPK